MIPLQEWQLKKIYDTFRLVSIAHNSSARQTCLDRDIMESWNFVADALNNVSADTLSVEEVISYRNRPGQLPKSIE